MSGVTVSVIIPTYYRNSTLKEAIESVYRQDYEPIEILVVDDSGENHAEPIVDSFEDVRYFSNDRNRGVQFAREKGYHESTGGYVQFLDDDDWLHESKISRQVELLEHSPDTGVVYCGILREDGRQILPDRDVRGEVLEHALRFRTSPCMPPTMLIRREVMRKVPSLTELPGDDYALKIELAQVTRFEYVDAPLYYRRISDDNLGTSEWAVRNRKQTLRYYEDLYDGFPPHVYRTALAYVYMLEGEVRLSEKDWSFDAISAFGKAAYYAPGMRIPFCMSFVASIFGKRGWQLASTVYSRYLLGDRHTGKHI